MTALRFALTLLLCGAYAVLLAGTAYGIDIAGPAALTIVGLLCAYAIVASIEADRASRTVCPMCGRRLDTRVPPPYAICTLCIARERKDRTS